MQLRNETKKVIEIKYVIQEKIKNFYLHLVIQEINRKVNLIKQINTKQKLKIKHFY